MGVLGVNPRFHFSAVLSSSTTGYNLKAAAIAAGWNGVAPLTASITIPNGVTVSSNNTSVPAFDTGAGFPAGSSLSLTLGATGRLIGMGGGGGAGTTGGSKTGLDGGPALKAQAAMTVTNNGTLAGGGGGGGGVAGLDSGAVARGVGGSGGRSGLTDSSGGFGHSLSGYDGTISNAAVGRSYLVADPGRNFTIYGGSGGDWGQPGSVASGFAGGSGLAGFGGPAVVGNSFITWLATGTRHGSIT